MLEEYLELKDIDRHHKSQAQLNPLKIKVDRLIWLFSSDKKPVAMMEYQQYSRDALSLPLKYTVTSLGPDRRHSKLIKSGSRPVSLCHGVMNDVLDFDGSHPDEKFQLGWRSLGENKGHGCKFTQTDESERMFKK